MKLSQAELQELLNKYPGFEWTGNHGRKEKGEVRCTMNLRPSYSDTRSAQQIAHTAIDDSTREDRIVRIDEGAMNEAIADLLRVECEDETDSGTETEFWGQDMDGGKWRVHVRKSLWTLGGAGPAEMIADELERILTETRLTAYVEDESGHDSLRSEESLVRTRLGGDYDPTAWDDAMELLRQRHG